MLCWEAAHSPGTQRTADLGIFVNPSDNPNLATLPESFGSHWDFGHAPIFPISVIDYGVPDTLLSCTLKIWGCRLRLHNWGSWGGREQIQRYRQ